MKTNEIIQITNEAKEITITKETMPDAVAMLSKLNKTLDSVTVEKEKVTAPLNAALKAERARWKPYELELESAIEALRASMTTYQTEARRIEEAQKEKIAEKVIAGRLRPETAVKKLDNLDTADDKVHTNEGSVGFMSVKKFELTDITMVPTDYLLVDEVAVRKAMKEGIELPGFRYYSEEVPVNRR